MLLATLLLLTCFVPAAYAQSTNDDKETLSVEYLSGFAFFKFAKAKPDLTTWVQKSDAYMQATPHIRANMLRGEVSLLQGMFDNHVVSEHPITVKTQIFFSVPTKSQVTRALKEKKKIAIPMKMVNDTDFLFPVQVGDMWIALIPQHLESMLDLELSEEEYSHFQRGMEDNAMGGKVTTTLQLTLMPTAADTKEPLQINGFDLWVLLADIMSFKIMSTDGERMAWFMDIPGYEKFNRNQNVYDLYK